MCLQVRASAAGLLLAAGAWIAAPAAAEPLDLVMESALGRSPAVASAGAQVDVARAELAGARAEAWPQASAQAQIGIGRIDPGGFFGLEAENTEPRVAQINVEWPLYTGGRISSAVRAAGEVAEAREAQRRSAVLQTRVAVADAYSRAAASALLVRDYEALVQALTEVRRQARLKFTAGEGTSTEVAQAEARLNEAAAGLIDVRGRRAIALAELEVLAGRPVSVDAAVPLPPPVPVSRNSAVAEASAGSPEIAAARRMAAAAEARVRSAKAERLPTLGAYAEASSVRDQFFPDYRADSASVGIRGRWNFFSGGRVGARIQAAEAERRLADAELARATDEVRKGAVAAYEQFDAARAMVEATEARAAAAREALRGVRLEVQVGAKPSLAQLDAERELIAAQATALEARGRLLVAGYRLLAIVGRMDDGAGGGPRGPIHRSGNGRR